MPMTTVSVERYGFFFFPAKILAEAGVLAILLRTQQQLLFHFMI
jgi:hypothetical protein